MFSVVIPYYKKRKYIERCLDSVYAQTFQNFEVILVDDGSEDDIEGVCKTKYPEVKLIQRNNHGVSTARNEGIAMASNPYICFLDADDAWSPVYLECVNQVIMKEGNVKIIGTHYTRDWALLDRLHSRNASYRLLTDYFQSLALRNTLFSSSSTTIQREFFLKNPGFNPTVKKGEDIDVWLRAVASGGKSVYIDKTLSFYSNEDEQQLTKVPVSLKDTIFWVYGRKFLNSLEFSLPSAFIKSYLRKNLWYYLLNPTDHQDALNIVKKIGLGNGFSIVLYSLPLPLKHIISRKPFKRYLHLYMKYLVK